MDGRRRRSSSFEDLSATANELIGLPSTICSTKANSHCFRVRCLSEKKTLKGKIYSSVDNIKKDAFAIYNDAGFNEDSAVLTYLDEQNVEVLLTSVPDLPERGHYKDLFIRFVHPICAMCSNPFGIVDNQLLFQCSRVKCGEQYCKDCVQSVRGANSEYPFLCITCKKEVTPQRNMLIEKHIIWKSMCKLYGVQSFFDLKINSKLISCYPILRNIKFRYIHLKSQLNILKSRIDLPSNQMKKQGTSSLFDEFLINNVDDLYNNLDKLAKRIKKTENEMKRRGIIVSNCLEKYRKAMKHFDRLCHLLVENIVKYQTVNNNVTSNVLDNHEQHIEELYRMNDLDKLSSAQNIKAVDGILEDIDFRRKCLSPRLEIMVSLLKDKPEGINLVENYLEQAKKKLEIISNIEEELKNLRQSLEMINQYIVEYDKLLRDDQYPEIPCSKFILLLEKMRVRIEQLEVSENFPKTIELMGKWQNDYGKDEDFKPKVIDLFKTMERDVQDLFADCNLIYSLSYKIGVIGHGGVGKSALVMKLAGVEEFSSMIAVERSTFGYLQFDTFVYEDPRNGKIIPIRFIDIEGATDTSESVSTGNYFELIKKTDCDMYIIAFADFFSDHNTACQEYIENDLKRKCVLVRNKADLLFNQYFQQIEGGKYENTPASEYSANLALSQIKEHASKTSDDRNLNDIVYSTAAVCDNNLKGAFFAEFDLNDLKKRFIELATTDFRRQRICNLAARTAITAINTCFRRGYTVSQTKYKLLAAGASIVPFLNEIPALFGREKIRQAFGVHDNFAVTNAVRRTKDSFEEYLMEKKLTVPKEYLKSGEFKYLIDETTTTSEIPIFTRNNENFPRNRAATRMRLITQAIGGPIGTAGIVVGSLMDDAVGIIVSTTATATQTLSMASIVIGVVLVPVFAAWNFYSTGRRMNRELHSICDDLAIILQCFIGNRCNDSCRNIQLPPHLPSNENPSSSDID